MREVFNDITFVRSILVGTWGFRIHSNRLLPTILAQLSFCFTFLHFFVHIVSLCLPGIMGGEVSGWQPLSLSIVFNMY